MIGTSKKPRLFSAIIIAASYRLNCGRVVNGNDTSVGQSFSAKNRLRTGTYHVWDGKIPEISMPEYQRGAI